MPYLTLCSYRYTPPTSSLLLPPLPHPFTAPHTLVREPHAPSFLGSQFLPPHMAKFPLLTFFCQKSSLSVAISVTVVRVGACLNYFIPVKLIALPYSKYTQFFFPTHWVVTLAVLSLDYQKYHIQGGPFLPLWQSLGQKKYGIKTIPLVSISLSSFSFLFFVRFLGIVFFCIREIIGTPLLCLG